MQYAVTATVVVLLFFICFSFLIRIVFINGSSFVAFCTLLSLNTLFFFPLPLFCSHCLFPLLSVSVMEAKRSQSISNCVHLYEAIPTTKSVPMLLHTVSSFLPGISSGNSACSHRLSGKVYCESYMCVCDLSPAFPTCQSQFLMDHHFHFLFFFVTAFTFTVSFDVNI